MTIVQARQIMQVGRERWMTRQRNLAELCGRLDLSQQTIASAIGLSHQQVHTRFRGKAVMNPWELEAVCELIGIGPEELDQEPDALLVRVSGTRG